MTNDQLIEKMVREVLSSMTEKENCNNRTVSNGNLNISKKDYPFGKNVPEKILTNTGIKLTDLTLEKVINGEISPDDIKISPQTLEMQSEIAKSVNRDAFANNLKRASELIAVPDERILEIYNALRPYRSTKKELYNIADELENKYNCNINSHFIREAADVYEKRGRLKK